MKPVNRIIKWAFLTVLIIAGPATFAQVGTLTQTGNQTVCLGTEPYGVVLNAGSTYAWSVTPLAGGNGTIAVGASPNLASVNWTSPGTATLQVIETNSSGCIGNTVLITVTVLPGNTINLTSAAGTDAQTICNNTPIINITYATTGVTGATVTGLPAGVNGVWAGNVVTISGTPSVSGTFTYTITLTGGCGVVTAGGTITVTSSNTITLTSAVGTDAQTACINTAITNINYATVGATGATVTGLPAGVNGVWAGNVVTISGTPSVSGTFTYTVTLTGGCGVVTGTGSITVTAIPATSPIYHN
jgi:hypothetical protein